MDGMGYYMIWNDTTQSKECGTYTYTPSTDDDEEGGDTTDPTDSTNPTDATDSSEPQEQAVPYYVAGTANLCGTA